MELFQLRYFVSVAKYENFSKAADELLVTQPSISKAISSLENELGVSLFDRKGKKIVLNDAGRLLLTRMYDIMPMLNNLPNELRSASYAEGNVIILKVLAAHEAVANLLALFKYENPSAFFQLVPERDAGRYDLCFLSVPDEVRVHNGAIVLEEEIMLAVSDESWMAGKKSVDLREMAREKFITTNRDCLEESRFSRFFKLSGYMPQVAYYSTNPHLTIDLVASGVGVSLWLPSSWWNVPLKGVKLLRINNPICRRSVFVTWPDSGAASQNVRKFLDFAKSYFQKLPSNLIGG